MSETASLERRVQDILRAAGHPELADEGRGARWRIVARMARLRLPGRGTGRLVDRGHSRPRPRRPGARPGEAGLTAASLAAAAPGPGRGGPRGPVPGTARRPVQRLVHFT